MTTMVGLMESARAFLPEFVLRRRRSDSTNLSSDVFIDDMLPRVTPEAVTQMIDRIVVPQLVVAHGQPRQPGTPVDIGEIAALALDVDAGALLERLEAMLERGSSVNELLIDVLAPAARHLGKLWEDDACDFVEVTMGLWRLQEVVRDFSSRVAPGTCTGGLRGLRGLFASAPHEQHNFGTVIVEDVFRRSGWSTDILLNPDRSELLDAIASDHYDLLGLTVSCEIHSARLAPLVAALRSVSRNPRLCIMLGGHLAATDPHLISRVGADCTAPDAQRAVIVAARWVQANACREVFTA